MQCKVMHLETNKFQAHVSEMTEEEKEVLKLKSNVGKRTSESKTIMNALQIWKLEEHF